MRFYADLHVHSRYAHHTSRNADLRALAATALRKGITVLGTGDFTHPAWFEELRAGLVPAEPGLYRLRDDLGKAVAGQVPASCRGELRLLLATEVATAFRRDGRGRRMHHLLYAPDLDAAARIGERLGQVGNVTEDGRPLLSMDARELLEATLASGDGAYLVPAHIWTPWVGVLSASTGFDSIEACYGELTEHIFAVETGLSADPPMCWRVSALDRLRVVSYGDAHGPDRVGREASRFDTDLDYFAIRRALQTPDGFEGTVELFPEAGRYHLSGHRRCGVSLEPAEARKRRMVCPVCGKRLTMGVLQRVEDLADRPEGARPAGAAGWANQVPQTDQVAGVLGIGPKSKAVSRTVDALIERLGPELPILERRPAEEIGQAGFPEVAEAIQHVRHGQVSAEPGYDGEYGSVQVAARAPAEGTRGVVGMVSTVSSPVGQHGRASHP
jgi:DNA helicase-2/ATP-dependent DNA helicase PcrA